MGVSRWGPVNRVKDVRRGWSCPHIWLWWLLQGLPRVVGWVGVGVQAHGLAVPPQLHSRVWGGSAELGGRSAGSSNRDPV